jgi:hypothetical protein
VRKLPTPRAGFGGCRCQAFALTGDAAATDPVCHLAPDHTRVQELAALRTDTAYDYRRMRADQEASMMASWTHEIDCFHHRFDPFQPGL